MSYIKDSGPQLFKSMTKLIHARMKINQLLVHHKAYIEFYIVEKIGVLLNFHVLILFLIQIIIVLNQIPLVLS